MKLLIKIPTRERGFDWLQSYYTNLTNMNTHIHLTLDEDEYPDGEVPDFGFPAELDLTFSIGPSDSKIDAYNRDIDWISKRIDWDVIMLGSDDMLPQIRGFDQQIIEDMSWNYPTADGCLWYNTEDSLTELKKRYKRNFAWGSDEWKKRWICMLPVMGRRYYERFGYVYHPSYKSFWCDNEWTDVARQMGLITPVNLEIVKHFHPSWGGGENAMDSLYSRNNKNFLIDQKNYHRRKLKGFPK